MLLALICTVVAFLTFTSATGQSNPTKESDELVRMRLVGFSAQLDTKLSTVINQQHLAGLLKYMRSDGAFLDGQGALGREAIREHVASRFGESTFLLTLRSTEAHLLTDYAGYTTGTYSLQGEFTKCKCAVSERGKYVLVWQVENREWRIKAWIPSSQGGEGCGCGGGVH
jgi:hypothetical protein